MICDLDSLHQDFQGLGIAFGANFNGTELVSVGMIFVLINGGSNLEESRAQIALLFAPDPVASHRNCHVGEQHHDGAGDNQLD